MKPRVLSAVVLTGRILENKVSGRSARSRMQRENHSKDANAFENRKKELQLTWGFKIQIELHLVAVGNQGFIGLGPQALLLMLIMICEYIIKNSSCSKILTKLET